MNLKKIHLAQNYVSIALAFLLLILFFSCQDEELTESDFSNISNLIKINKDFNDIKDDKNINLKIKSISQTLGVNSKLHRLNNSLYQLNLTSIKYIEYDSYHSYTFLLLSESNEETLNLVLSLQDDGSYEAFLISYVLSASEITQLKGGDITDLQSKIKVINIDDFDITSISQFRNLDSCYEPVDGTSSATGWNIIQWREVPCDGEIGGDQGSNTGWQDASEGPYDPYNSNYGNTNPYGTNDNTVIGGGSNSNTVNNGNNVNNTIDLTGATDPFFFEDILISINGILDEDLSPSQIEWLENNQNKASLIRDFIVEHQSLDVSFNEALNSIITQNSATSWLNITGSVNEVPSLSYFKKRTHNFPGGPVVEYALNNGDFVCYGDYGEGDEIDEKWFYYSTNDNLPYWYEMLEPSSYDHTDLDFIFNAFWSDAALPLVRYATPLEDIIILIDGHNFEGVAESQAVAGVFIIVDLVPGGKVLKIVKKVGGPILETAPVITKIATPLYKGQKQIVKQVKEGTIALSNSLRKGNFAEMLIDTEWFERGYKRLHTNPTTHLNQGGHGIDHIFKNEQTGEFIIVETKYGTGSIQQADLDTGLPRQMSDDWIRNSVEQNGQTRLYNALAGNANLLNEIGVNYQRVIAKVKPDGSVAYRLINEDGYVILGNQGIFNP